MQRYVEREAEREKEILIEEKYLFLENKRRKYLQRNKNRKKADRGRKEGGVEGIGRGTCIDRESEKSNVCRDLLKDEKRKIKYRQINR